MSQARKRGWFFGSVLLLGVLGAALMAVPFTSSWAANKAAATNGSANGPSIAVTPSTPGTSYAKTLSEAFRTTARSLQPAVVSIRTEGRAATESPMDGKDFQKRFHFNNPEDLNDFFKNMPEMRRFFDSPSAMAAPDRSGLGSGVIIDPSGIILTNNHVVAGGSEVTVRLHDGREFEAKEVKVDPKTDIAVVRIEGATDLVAAPMGNSDNVEIGDWVLALGQPFGLVDTVTAGIISAKGRGIGIADREYFLQTDAAINPGNSGGPLVNLDGEVIGINTAISSSSGGNQGIGFAVPINMAHWVSDQLIKTGSVHRAYLGVGIQPVTHDLALRFGTEASHGVLVSEVRDGSPAAKAGFESGDIILSFAGHEVTSPRELQLFVERAPLDKAQEVVVLRDGKQVTLKVQCAAFPGEEEQASINTPEAETSAVNQFGLEVGPLNADVAKKLGMPGTQGLVVTDVEVGSAAAEAGLRSGMVIVEVDRKPVHDPAAFKQMVNDADLNEGLLLLVKTEQGKQFVVLKNQS